MDLYTYLKIPFKHQGRDFNGADCFGMLRLFYLYELGVDLPDYTNDYPEDWWTEQSLITDLYREYKFIEVSTFERGNVLLFKNTSTIPGHIGIVLDDSAFLHMTRTGAGTNNYRYGMWARQIHSVYRLDLHAYTT